MSIHIRCYYCQEEFQLEYPQSGEKVFCPCCGQMLVQNFPKASAKSHTCPECGYYIDESRMNSICPDCGTLFHESCHKHRLSEGRECPACINLVTKSVQNQSQTPFANPIISAPPVPTSTSLDNIASSEVVTPKRNLFAQIFNNISDYFEQRRRDYNAKADEEPVTDIKQKSQDNPFTLSPSIPSPPPVPSNNNRWSNSEELQPVTRERKSEQKVSNSKTIPVPPPIPQEKKPSMFSKAITAMGNRLPLIVTCLITIALGIWLDKSGSFEWAWLMGLCTIGLGLLFLLRNGWTRFVMSVTGLFALLGGLATLVACGYVWYDSPDIDVTFFRGTAIAGFSLITLFIFAKWTKKRYRSSLVSKSNPQTDKNNADKKQVKTENNKPVTSKPTLTFLSVICTLGLLATASFAGWKQYESTKLSDLTGYFAQKGVADAQYANGLIYQDEKSPLYDESTALEWFDRATQQKYIPACAQSAQMHHDAIGCSSPDYELAFTNWKTAAEGRDVTSMVRLGDCYSEGEGTEQDYVKAAQMYLEAAHRNSSEAQYKIAQMHFDGIGVKADSSEGWYWLDKSANAEYPDAMFLLGKMNVNGQNMPVNYNIGLDWISKAESVGQEDAKPFLEDFYLNGIGLEKAPKRALVWLAKASKEGSTKATEKLNEYFLVNNGLEKFPEEGFQWLESQAQAGNEVTQNRVGECYRDGIGTAKSPTSAVSWFEKAAKNLNPDGQYNLGQCYLTGLGVTENPDQAFEWFNQSALNKHVNSMYELGRCYFNGTGCNVDKPEGASWLYKAATAGHRQAGKDLDEYFLNQDGLDKCPTLAVTWLKKRAEEGNAIAQKKLDEYYLTESAIENNADEAIAALKAKAEKGDSESQTKLGNYYLNGIGVKKNVDEGLVWLEKAANQDYEPARDILDQYTMSPDAKPTEFSIQWITRRARDGYGKAEFYLGNYYLTDDAFNSESFQPSEGIEWLEKAIKHNVPGAKKRLETFYLSDSALQNVPDKCISWLSEQTNNPTAQFRLYKYYSSTNPDKDKSARYLQSSAKLGQPEAQYLLGTSLVKDKSTASQGYAYLKAAADKGIPDAQYEAGLCCLNGTGTPQSDANAVEFFSKAVQNGNAKAQYEYGKCLAQGQGVGKNSTKAVQMFKSAAKQGIPEAMYEYGVCCRDGIGCSVDNPEAYIHFCKAADEGVALAECEKGKCLLKGIGTNQNASEGFRILKACSGNGVTDAQTTLDDFCLNNPKAITLEPEQTTEWLTKRAGEGSKPAVTRLDELYVTNGEISSMSPAGVQWVKESAGRGNAKAKLKLAQAVQTGNANGSEEQIFNLYKGASEKGKGDPEAIYQLGVCYNNGIGTAVSYPKATTCFEMAANAGHAKAQAELGHCYYSGNGKEKNPEQAVVWLTKAANAGVTSAQKDLGMCYKNGIGVPKNYSMAAKWLTSPAQENDKNSLMEIADCYLKLGQPQNAIQWLDKGAQNGYSWSERQLGLCYLNGNGVYKNPSKAVTWLKKAADQGDIVAQSNLGKCYLEGTGVEKDVHKAIALLNQATSASKDYPNGYPDAKYLLGKIYMEGLDGEKDVTKGEQYLQTVAKDVPEANQLLQEYYMADGLNNNPEQAVAFIKAQAEAGNALAQANYGICYRDGIGGVAKNLKLAFEWFEKSANQDCPDGLYFLGLCYYQGWGTEADPTKASPLFKKAVELSDHPLAKQKLKEMGQIR